MLTWLSCKCHCCIRSLHSCLKIFLIQIASCDVCSTGLGAKRKAKPPRQRRDIPQNGPPLPPRKKIKVAKPRKPSVLKKAEDEGPLNLNTDSSTLLRNDLSSVGAVLDNELVPTSQIVMDLNHQPHPYHQQAHHQQQREQSTMMKSTMAGPINTDLQTQFVSTTQRSSLDARGSLDATEVNFHQIFTTIEEECSDQVR